MQVFLGTASEIININSFAVCSKTGNKQPFLDCFLQTTGETEENAEKKALNIEEKKNDENLAKISKS